MVSKNRENPASDRIGEVICSVQLPLENVEYALEQYLLENGQRLDTETRILLAGIRDCVGRVAVTARRLSQAEAEAAGRVGRAA